eukprot:4980103-Alexandrium_andersonii.AAC.1
MPPMLSNFQPRPKPVRSSFDDSNLRISNRSSFTACVPQCPASLGAESWSCVRRASRSRSPG